CYDIDRCEKEIKPNDFAQDLLFGWNTIDNENETSEETNFIQDREDKPSNPKEWFIVTSTEGKIDPKFDYSINSSQLLIGINQIDLLSSNDDIKRHICDSVTSITDNISDTLFPSHDNELDFSESMNYEAEAAVQNIVDIIVKQPLNIEACPVETSCTNDYEQNSDDLTLHLPDQMAQPMILLPLSTSLQ
ncbi:unnamed protein product, partial [Rotaria sp. Silwood2]